MLYCRNCCCSSSTFCKSEATASAQEGWPNPDFVGPEEVDMDSVLCAALGVLERPSADREPCEWVFQSAER